MAFGPDGSLYVAESGPPGKVTVPLPVNFGGEGPIGRRAAIAKIAPSGGRARQWVTGLPNIGLYGGVEMLGAAAVAFHGGSALRGRGRAHDGVAEALAGRARREAPHGRRRRRVQQRPPAAAAERRRRPGRQPVRHGQLGKKLYISDGNYNRVLVADPLTGGLKILATFYPGPVTVGMAVAPDRKEIYVAQYGNAPYLPGSGYITAVTPERQGAEGGHGPDDADRHGLREGRDAVRPPVRREVRRRSTFATSPTPAVAAPDRQGRDEARRSSRT